MKTHAKIEERLGRTTIDCLPEMFERCSKAKPAAVFMIFIGADGSMNSAVTGTIEEIELIGDYAEQMLSGALARARDQASGKNG